MSPDHQPVEKGHPMNDPSVRKQKSGDQLAVGDWLAPGEVVDDRPAEVLYALAYPASADRSRDNDGKHVHLVVREQGGTAPFANIVAGNTLFDLATDEDLAALRESAERAQKIAEVRALATWLEERPWLPIPGLHCNDHLYGLDGYRKVLELAGRPGGELDTRLDDRTVVKFREGPLHYSVIAWHEDGRPAEPAPVDGANKEPYLGWAGSCAASLHIPTPGETCGVCGAEGMLSAQHVEVSASAGDTCGAECACGVTVSGFDSLAEAREALTQHIADPGGLDFGRADTAEADDPTPVSGGRIQPHTGEMVGTTRDARLVDADAPPPDGPLHHNTGGEFTACGLVALRIPPGHGLISVREHVTCPNCVTEIRS
jgi:hypothetical protein